VFRRLPRVFVGVVSRPRSLYLIRYSTPCSFAVLFAITRSAHKDPCLESKRFFGVRIPLNHRSMDRRRACITVRVVFASQKNDGKGTRGIGSACIIIRILCTIATTVFKLFTLDRWMCPYSFLSNVTSQTRHGRFLGQTTWRCSFERCHLAPGCHMSRLQLSRGNRVSEAAAGEQDTCEGARLLHDRWHSM
jgi:hypothetical protein